ncbi:MAG: hypothetical protein AAGH99_09180 [Planctomycetota bacterium]
MTPSVFILVLVGGVVLLALIFLMSLSWLANIRRVEVPRNTPNDVEWEVLRTYTTPEQAHLDRAMLEGCGVPARLANEHTVGTDWMYGVAVGVDLRVPQDQLESAELLLRDARLGDASVDLDASDFEQGIDRKCPECGSAEIYRTRPGVGWALASVVLLGLPLLFRKRYQCEVCGRRERVAHALA